MNWLLYFFLFGVFSFDVFSQVRIVSWKDKTYKAYVNLSSVSKLNPDSIEGLILIGNDFNDFPKEVLRFKNLRYLEIDSYRWSEVLDSLTAEQKAEYYRIKANSPEGFLIQKFYKPNRVRRIPKKIKSLKKLEVVDLSGVIIKDKRRFVKIYKYLPNVEIIPAKELIY